MSNPLDKVNADKNAEGSPLTTRESTRARAPRDTHIGPEGGSPQKKKRGSRHASGFKKGVKI